MVPNDPPRSYLGPISLLLTRTSLYIHSNYLHSNTLLANPFQVLVARPRNSHQQSLEIQWFELQLLQLRDRIEPRLNGLDRENIRHA